jgi:hypothetical protein
MVDRMLMQPRRPAGTSTPSVSARAPRRLLVASLVLAAALSGCGRTTVSEHSAVLSLRVGEYDISPEAVQIHAGVIRLEVTDDGVLAHQVAVSGGDGGRFYEQTSTIFPGRTKITRPFTIAPGHYRVYDPGANYADLGAYGTLTVLAC